MAALDGLDRLVALLRDVPTEARGEVLMLAARLVRARTLLADAREVLSETPVDGGLVARIDSMLAELEQLV